VVRVVVLPSPLLGPEAYEPLARALARRGHRVHVAEVVGRTVQNVLAGFVLEARGADLLVAHSNAGRFAPAVAHAVGARIVYVDGLLAGVGDTEGFAAFVRSRADEDGTLPGWTDWWPADEIAEVVPEAWLPVIQRTQPRLPVDFLLTDPPYADQWRTQLAGYLTLGEAYVAEVDAAAALGWPVTRLDGGHLYHLVDPDAVATAVDDLSAEVVARAP
jgi:hypothetical protein